MTIRGALSGRLLGAVGPAIAGALLVWGGLAAIEDAPFLGLTLGAASVVAFGLSTRALASRVVLDDTGVVLHPVVRSRSIPWAEVAGFGIGRLAGRDVVVVNCRDGRDLRLPLLTQPSGRDAVLKLRGRLSLAAETYIRRGQR